MAENSLFAILLRSPWWVSFLVSASIIVLASLMLPPRYVLFGSLVGLPFMIMGTMLAWQQLRAPSAASVAAIGAALQAMSWPEFSSVLAEALRRDGYEVTALSNDADADFEIARSGRSALLACRRWKAARVGVEPLRGLRKAMLGKEVDDSIYVSLGDMTEQARRFVIDEKIRIIDKVELARLLQGLVRPASAAGS